MNTKTDIKQQHPAALPQAKCSVPVAAVDQLVRQLERIERLESALTEIMNLCQVAGLGIETPAMKAPSTYRLLSFGHGYRTSGNGCRAFGNREAPPLPPSEERKNRNSPSPSRPSSTFGRLQTADRIALENKLKAFQEKAKRLAGDLSDRVQRETRPADVDKLIEELGS